MVSSDTARMGIIRRAHDPRTHTVTRYRDVRDPIRSYLSDSSRNVKPLLDAERLFQQRSTDPSESAMRQEDARLSMEVVNAIQGMGNRLGQYTFTPAPQRQNKLTISGVEVSVRADLLVHGQTRGIEQTGAAILRVTKDDATLPIRLSPTPTICSVSPWTAGKGRLHWESVGTIHFHASTTATKQTYDIEGSRFQ